MRAASALAVWIRKGFSGDVKYSSYLSGCTSIYLELELELPCQAFHRSRLVATPSGKLSAYEEEIPQID